MHADNSIWVEIAVFVLGGGAYGLMEILFRGHTHWTMLVTGGACALTLFYLRAAACGQRAGGRDHHYGLRTGGRPAGQCEVRLACLGLFRAAWQCAGADLSDVYRDLVRGLLFVPVGGAPADACGLSTGYGKRAGCHEA